MLERASIGAFLNLTAFEPEAWKRDLALYDELRLDHVELWLEFEPSKREVAVLRSVLGSRTSIMHAPFIGMSLATHWDELATLSVSRSHRAIEVAGILGCHVVTLHAGPYAKFDGHTRACERLTERIGRFARIASPRVTLENLPERGGATRDAVSGLADLEHVLALLPSLHATLDVGHCLQNGEDPLPFILENVPRIANIHIHDGHVRGGAHQALGTGDLPTDELLAALDGAGYAGFLTIETLSEEALRASLDVLAGHGVTSRRVLSGAA